LQLAHGRPEQIARNFQSPRAKGHRERIARLLPNLVINDSCVMPGLEPGIQPPGVGVWMAGSSPAMTVARHMSFSLRDLVSAIDFTPQKAAFPFTVALANIRSNGSSGK
jgi:hypothetical protein